MDDAELAQLASGQVFAGAVGVVGQQHFIARFEQAQIHQRQRSQTAGRQQALQAAFQRGDALFERERGGRAVQAVGVGAFVHPLALAHGRHVGKEHGRRLVHRRLRSLEFRRRNVGVVYEPGGRSARRGCG